MLKGGVIMDVVTPEQAVIAEEAGAVAVMALERVPSDIRASGGVARMSDPEMIDGDHGRGEHPGHGQGPHRPLRRGAGPRGPGRGLHRRVRGPHPRRRAQPHRQARLQGPVRVRLPEPRRGAAPDQRGRGDDAHQGRGRHRQRRRGGPPAARRARRDPPPPAHARGRAVRRGEGAPGPVRPGQAGRGRGQAPGRQLRGRRHLHPGRRRAGDAAGRRGRVRGLRHLQGRGPGAHGQRHRPGDDPLRRRRRSSPRSPRAWARRCAASPWRRSRSSERLAVRGW